MTTAATGARVTVDKARYLSREFAAIEQEKLWRNVWLHAVPEDLVATPGRFVTLELGGADVLVVRGRDGVLRAFHNVCLHRGRRLVEAPCGETQSLRCPFHHWQWHTDGTLANIPDRECFTGLKILEDPGLKPLACGTWGGQVWVHLGVPDVSLEAWLAPVREALARYDLRAYSLTEHTTFALPCNWKTIADAFNETYHLRAVHPYLLGAIDDTQVTTELHGPHSLQVIPLARPSARLANAKTNANTGVSDALAYLLRANGADPGALAGDATRGPEVLREALRARGLDAPSDEELTTARSWFVFPSVTINVYPHELMLHRYRPSGGDPEQMWFDQIVLTRVAPGAKRPAPPAMRVLSPGEGSAGQVTDDDVRNLVQVQRGMHSPGFSQLVLGDHEQRIAHLHAVLDTYLAR